MSPARDSADRDWTSPGAWEAAPGIYRIPLPMPANGLRAVNVYALADGDSVTLIDAGWASAQARAHLETGLAAIGRSPADVGEILVTHSHSDHYGLAMHLRRDFGSRIRVGEAERENIQGVIDDWDSGFHSQHDRLIAAGAGEVVERHRSWLAAHPEGGRMAGEFYELPDGWIADGEDLEVGSRRLAAVSTPGHTVGHLVFADRAGDLLFSGDHVLPSITPSISFEPARPRLPLRDFLRSLETVLSLREMRLLPSHGPIGMSSHQRAGELLEHHERRLDETQDAVESGSRTALDVARDLSWTRRRRPFAELDAFNQMLAVNETIAHLELLVERGRLGSASDGGFTRYEANAG